MYKGYPSQLKINDKAPMEFGTVEPVREEQHAPSVLAHQFVRLIGSDAAEANDDVLGQIKATAHAALKGDVIRITSGAYSGREVKVWKVEANLIHIVDSIAPAAAVSFDILRHKYPLVGADGTIPVTTTVTPAPIQYVLDGVDTDVEEDSGTPADSRPLPVKVLNGSGAEVGFATQTTLAALLTELQLKADLSETQPVSAASLPLPTGAATSALQGDANTKLDTIAGHVDAVEAKLDTVIAKDFATQTTLAALLTELQLKADLTDTQPVSAAQLPAALGQGTMAQSMKVVMASDQAGIKTFQDRVASGTIANVLNAELVLDVQGCATVGIQLSGTWTGTCSYEGTTNGTDYFAILALPRSSTGIWAVSATVNTQAMLICAGLTKVRVRKSVAGTGTVQCDIVATAGAAVAQTYQLNANSAFVSSAQSGNWSVRAQDGSGNSLTSELLGALRGLHTKDLGASYADSVRKDYSAGSVTTGAWVELIASTAAESQGLTLFDSSGQTLELGTGAAAAESRKLIIPPGGLNGFIPLRIAAGTRVAVRAVSATASVGELNITLLG